MFLTTVFRKKSIFSLIAFISLILITVSVSFGAAVAADAEKRREEKLVLLGANLKSIISGAYFSPAATFIVNNNGD